MIRNANINDYDDLNKLFDIGDKLHRGALPEMFQRPSGPIRELTYFKELLDNQDVEIFLAFENDKLIGVIVGQIMESPKIPIMKTYRYGFIDNLVVDEGYRKKGIGKELLSKLHQWFDQKEVDEARLNVFDFNENAIRFYYNNGYNAYSRRMRRKL